MTKEDIEKILNHVEGLKIEFKEARTSIPSSFYETAVSFSNTDGGTILLGVNNEGRVTGIEPTATQKLQRDLVTALNTPECINPPLFLQPFTVMHPDGIVMVVQVPASSQVHDHAGRIYIRQADADIDITKNQHILTGLYLRKQSYFTESSIFPYLEMSDLDGSLFEKARQLIKSNKGDHPWLQVSDEQMLKDSNLWRRDHLKQQEGLTLAAGLIFGKDTTIGNLVPAYKVEAIRRVENLDRWDDRLSLRTNLIDTYLELKRFVDKHLPDKFYMEGDQRIDLRDKIFREVVGNMIVHREYTSAYSSDMIITKSAVTLTNPNKPLFHGLIDPAGFNPYPKNPNIRKFFTAFGWTDEIGSGIRNTNKYLPLYVPGAKPLFWEDNIFKTEIPLITFSFGNIAETLIDVLDFHDKVDKERMTVLKETSINPIFNDLASDIDELLFKMGCTWYEKGVKFDKLRFLKNNNIQINDLRKELTSPQKGVKLLKKRGQNILKTLILLLLPLSLDNLVELLGFNSKNHYREDYIKPLKDNGLIMLTIPDNPNDPEQKYVISEKGKMFLGGV